MVGLHSAARSHLAYSRCRCTAAGALHHPRVAIFCNVSWSSFITSPTIEIQFLSPSLSLFHTYENAVSADRPTDRWQRNAILPSAGKQQTFALPRVRETSGRMWSNFSGSCGYRCNCKLASFGERADIAESTTFGILAIIFSENLFPLGPLSHLHLFFFPQVIGQGGWDYKIECFPSCHTRIYIHISFVKANILNGELFYSVDLLLKFIKCIIFHNNSAHLIF